jgi:hypothetical protein
VAYKRSRVSKTQERLTNKLYFLVFLIVIILAGLVFALAKYGPEIGSLFGFVSKHRNEGPSQWLSVQAPIFSYIPEAVKENKVTLEGNALPTTSVKLFVNGPEVSRVITDLEGKFMFPDVELIDGKNTIFAKAVGEGNVESTKSEILYITVDKDKPKVEITDPGVNEVVRNLNKTVLIQGKVNEKAAVTINDRSARLGADLTFELLIGVSEGENKIEIVAKDPAGNETKQTYTFRYEKRAE